MILNPLDHPISLATPNRLTAVSAWHQHIPFAMFLVSVLKPRLIVELGTHAGDSYCGFCQAVKELALETRCFAIDTWEGDEHSGSYGPEILDDLRKHHDPLYGSFSRLFQSTFDDALPSFADGTISILHIDGYHTYEAVKHDFESWLPKLGPDGIVLFHDTNVRERGFGVREFWDEIAERYPHFEFMHGHGLGVLAVGESRSKELQALLRATPDETAALRSFFFELGHLLTLKLQLESKENSLSSVTLAANDLKEDLSREVERGKRVTEKLMSERIEHVRVAGLLSNLQAEQESVTIERNNLLSQLAERDESLALLSDRVAQAEGEVRRLAAEIISHGQTLERSLEAERAQFAHQIVIQDRQLALKERELERKERELQTLTSTLGWRLLSLYGPVKYRLLLPAYRSLRSLFKALLRGEYHPRVVPLNDLRPRDDNGEWESTAPDPQFEVRGPWPTGLTKVSIEIETEAAVADKVRLYINRGEGYTEALSYDLGETNRRQEQYISIDPNVIGMRLDPLESATRFKIREFVLKRVPGSKAIRNNGSEPRSRSNLPRFVQFSVDRAHSYRLKNGRWPRVSDVPGAVRRTLRAWAHHAGAPAEQDRTARYPQSFQVPRPIEPYEAWLEVNEWNSRREYLLRERLAKLPTHPLLSVVMPVCNPPLELLNRAIKSVVAQVYDNWELCIANDATTDPAVKDCIERWAAHEPRIRFVFSGANSGSSPAKNIAAELALGDYIAMMDQSDEITQDALGEVAIYTAENPQTDLLYSDDDKIDRHGQRFDPQFKPDWSPELLLSCMYFSHLFVLRRQIFQQAGGFREGFDNWQDYDLALRATELTHQVGHIPRILYHAGVIDGSTEPSAQSSNGSRGLRAIQEALERRGIRAAAVQVDAPLETSSAIFSAKFLDDGPRVAIIIPEKDLASLRACLDSLRKTTYGNYEVVIIDNESDDPATLDYLNETQHKVLRIANSENQFSLAAICNRAVEQINADYVLFLNNNTEVVKPEWLSQMAGLLGLPGAGAVGARLISRDQSIEHAGIVHGYHDGMAGPAFKLLPASNSGYLNYPIVTRNYSAVTSDCMLTPRNLFLELGGFDEKTFPGAFAAIDYCQRLRAAGYRVVYCPDAELIYNEGPALPGPEKDPREQAAFRKRYGRIRDPYYNPNLSLEHERFAIDAGTIAPETLRPIRVLMCAFNLNLEGAPHSQFELTRGLKRRGVIEPLVYCPQDGPLRKLYEDEGAQVEVLEHPLAGVHTPEAYEQAIQQFAELVRAWNVELVYGNTRQTFYAIAAAKRIGLPSIWNPRESEPWQTYFDYLGPEVSAHALGCFAYPYKVIFVADASREGCSDLNTRHNFMTIHNGLDQEIFAAAARNWPRQRARSELRLTDDDIMVLLPGTVCERKGQIDLIEAFGLIGEQHTSRLRCFIVGDRAGEYSERLKATHNRLPDLKRARIEVIPETPDIARYYGAADIFVCTSRVESFPRVILEAMASGLPIVTTPVYGISEQVQENVNALFYPPGNARELADRITNLLVDPGLRQRLGANSRPVLETLQDFDTMLTSYGKVFREAWLSGRTR